MNVRPIVAHAAAMTVVCIECAATEPDAYRQLGGDPNRRRIVTLSVLRAPLGVFARSMRCVTCLRRLHRIEDTL